ncbi:MAG: DUF5013 domain-containing protein [Adhaeribacter sp.]
MKYLFKKIASGILACNLLFLTACEKDELKSLESITPKVYITQVNGGTINLMPSNVIIDKERKVIKALLGISRSGNQAREAYSVEIIPENSNLPAGTVPLASDLLSGTHIEVPAGKAAGSFYLTIPKAVLDENQGKKLGLRIRIANPSQYELNEQLATANILLDVNNFADRSVDVTSKYVKNAGNPFKRSDVGASSRFGLLADWMVNDAVKNMENNTKGGFDSFNNGGWMSLERWGTPAIPNGKIYQTAELPAGKYLFEIASFDGSPGYTVKDQAFVTVAEGETLPDATDVTTALVAAPFDAPKAAFTLDTKKTVSFGISANFVQDSQYFRIKQVKLTQFLNIFE